MQTIKNHVFLIGNLGNDPEVVKFDSGKKTAKFSLATNEDYINQEGEKITNTQWHNVVAWGNLAGIIEKYLKKGSEVCVSGSITYRTYTDSEQISRKITEVKAHEIYMNGPKPVNEDSTEEKETIQETA